VDTMNIKDIPSNILLAVTKYADLKRAEGEAKLARERVAAQLDTIIRNSGEKKPTEAAIANTIKLHPEMEAAETTLLEASHALDKAKAELEFIRAVRDTALFLAKESV
jgi:hypothetical protein